MNVLFVTLSDIKSVDNNGIYEDLLREFSKNGSRIFVISPSERRNRNKTHLIKTDNAIILKVQTGNIQKTNLIEKGIATILLETQFISAIKKYLSNIKFDLVLYSTPPVTLAKVISYVKKRDNAKTYLLLKDIFPQNAVDIGMMRKNGITGILYHYFRRKEKKLYAISDRIGCMSQANVDYILRHNPEVNPAEIEICPNTVEVQDMSVTAEERATLREKYQIPLDKKVFVYGGNLGRPQGIPFILECLKTQKENPNAYFLIVGDGTEYAKLKDWFDEAKPPNIKLMSRLPKEDYDKMVAACDVGLIFLDHRFTIPNFPSRLLSYMQAKLPVLACTDPNTDIGKVICEGGFGWWCESNDTEGFNCCVADILECDLNTMGQAGFGYLLEHYTAKKAAQTIVDALK